MKDATTWVGLDAHKATIQVAMLLPGGAAPVEWQIANEPAAVRRLARKVQRAAPGECGAAMKRESVGTRCSGSSKRRSCRAR